MADVRTSVEFQKASAYIHQELVSFRRPRQARHALYNRFQEQGETLRAQKTRAQGDHFKIFLQVSQIGMCQFPFNVSAPL